MRRVRIIIADPADLARRGLRALISARRDLEVVAACKAVDDVVGRSTTLAPDIVLLGYGFSRSERLEAIRQIVGDRPGTPVLVLADRLEFDAFLALVQAGAQAYLSRDIDGPEIIEAIRTVSSGGCVMDPNSTRDLFAYMASATDRAAGLTAPSSPDDSPLEKLTPREREVLRLMAQGRGNKEIGTQLGISVGTVKTHVWHIFRKLQVSDRTGAVLVALEIDPTRVLPAA
jgi:DNA-binding NarL/FixJ family response regulator